MDRTIILPTGDKIRFEAYKVLHIGAHKGEEAIKYCSMGIEGWHIEANPEIYEELKAKVNSCERQYSFSYCLSEKEDEVVDFHILNTLQGSSCLELGSVKKNYPKIKLQKTIKLKTTTVDAMLRRNEIPTDIDFLVIDVEGFEMSVLKGAKKLLELRNIRYALIEVAAHPIHKGQADYIEVCSFLKDYNLYLRHVMFNGHGWADAFFQNNYWDDIGKKIEA